MAKQTILEIVNKYIKTDFPNKNGLNDEISKASKAEELKVIFKKYDYLISEVIFERIEKELISQSNKKDE